MKVEIYSDVVCPWCYIGKRRFARALAAFPGGEDVEVVFRPYQLDPMAPDEPVPTTEYLARRFGRPPAPMLAQVSAAGEGEGIAFAWDRALSVNTRLAHRLLRLAEREFGTEVQQELLERLFAAHFTDGANIADPDVLAGLAVASGMDEPRARAYLASDEGAAELEQEFAAARVRDIRSVPTFIFDDQYAVSGAQPASTFLQVLEEVQRRSAEAAANAEDAVDGCAGGACAAR